MSDGQIQRVLVVEDEMMVALYVEDIVTELGHEVVGPAMRLEEGLTLAREAAIDMAILDVNLHGARSFPIADALSARGIPFIFATGYGTQGLTEAYRDVITLQKPFASRDVEQAFARIRRGP